VIFGKRKKLQEEVQRLTKQLTQQGERVNQLKADVELSSQEHEALMERVQKERRKFTEFNMANPQVNRELAQRAVQLLRYGPLQIGTTPSDPVYSWTLVEQEVRRIEAELNVE
jgi:chromosome segregation ATPase